MGTTPAETVLNAIEVMSAWAAEPDGPPNLLIACLGRHLDERPPDEALIAATELIMGMTTLCGVVLSINEEATGFDMEVTLRKLALHYAADDHVARSMRQPTIGWTHPLAGGV